MFKVKKGKAILLVAAATAFVAAIAYDKKNSLNLNEDLKDEDLEDEFLNETIKVEDK